MNRHSKNYFRLITFWLMHIACLGVIWVSTSATAVNFALAAYITRMFILTGFYHRYFAHRTFKMNRFWQFIFALAGLSAMQRGAVWWASHHRQHHAKADHTGDPHSPIRNSFWWSHAGWLMQQHYATIDQHRVRDLLNYPELMWLEQWDKLIPLLLLIIIYFAGQYLALHHPNLHTTGWQLVVWWIISTVALAHAMAAINSFAHRFGSRRYHTPDQSRNNVWIALLTLGEGWHNNHHHYPGATRQGFYWWEIDITYYLLKVLNWFGIIHSLRPVPLAIRNTKQIRRVN